MAEIREWPLFVGGELHGQAVPDDDYHHGVRTARGLHSSASQVYTREKYAFGGQVHGESPLALAAWVARSELDQRGATLLWRMLVDSLFACHRLAGPEPVYHPESLARAALNGEYDRPDAPAGRCPECGQWVALTVAVGSRFGWWPGCPACLATLTSLPEGVSLSPVSASMRGRMR